ncbi:MAG: MarR family transcriptional regulator [Bifidobacterium sp.]
MDEDDCETRTVIFGGLTDISPFGTSLIRLVSAHSALLGVRFREIGLYPSQAIILSILHRKSGISQTELMSFIGHANHASITKSIMRMENRGLLSRYKSDWDKRATLVALTDQGKDMAESVDRVWHDAESQITSKLSPEEISGFQTLVDKVTTAIGDQLSSYGERQTFMNGSCSA